MLRSLLDTAGTLEDTDPREALRLTDRAWRTYPGEAARIAPLYGRRLLADREDLAAALAMLTRADALAPSPEVSANLVRVLIALGRPEAAIASLGQALSRYALVPGGPVEAAGCELLEAVGQHAVGFVGLDAHLDVCGIVSSGTVSVSVGDQTVETSRLDSAPYADARRF
jgi:tetratricopeptide (TPR) repeat protein